MDASGRAEHLTWPEHSYDHVVDVGGIIASRDPIGYAKNLISVADRTLWIDRRRATGPWYLSPAFFLQLAHRNGFTVAQIAYAHVQLRRLGRQPWSPPEARYLELSEASVRAKISDLLT
jgi:hypothetical protein